MSASLSVRKTDFRFDHSDTQFYKFSNQTSLPATFKKIHIDQGLNSALYNGAMRD